MKRSLKHQQDLCVNLEILMLLVRSDSPAGRFIIPKTKRELQRLEEMEKAAAGSEQTA